MRKTIKTISFLIFIGAAFITLAQDKAVAYRVTSSNINKSFQNAVDQYYNGNTDSAILIYQQILALDDHYEPAYLELAALNKELGNVKMAQNYFKRLYELKPTNVTYQKEFFISSVQAHNFADAEKELENLPKDDARLAFYTGLMMRDQKHYDEAIEALDQATDLQEFMPEAYYFKALAYMDAGKYKEAITEFNMCLKQDANFTTALYPLGICYEKSGSFNQAITTLVRARSNLPEDKEIQLAINRVVKKAPTYQKDVEKARKERREHADPPALETFPPSQAKNKDKLVMVRIGIVEEKGQVSIKAGANYILADSTHQYKGKQHDLLNVKQLKKSLNVYNDASGKLLFSTTENLKFSYSDKTASTAVFDILNGAGYFFAGSVDRYYRGSFEFLNRTKGITLVNILELEEYLYSVVPSEIPALWPAEALKVQAVAARTYTLATMGTYSSRGFDLYGSIISHAYTGVKGEHKNTTKAVNDTAGEVLYSTTNKNELLITYYSANHGGYSESGAIAWNGKRGLEQVAVADKKLKTRKNNLQLFDLDSWVKDPPQTYSNWGTYYNPIAYRSQTWVPAREMNFRVARQKNVGEIKALIARKRGISGRVGVVEAVGSKGQVLIEGDTIRSRTGGLRSNLYTLDLKLDAKGNIEFFIFNVAGWGHGIGMDQTGAAGMAADGYKYKEILKHYYPKSQLKTYKIVAKK